MVKHKTNIKTIHFLCGIPPPSSILKNLLTYRASLFHCTSGIYSMEKQTMDNRFVHLWNMFETGQGSRLGSMLEPDPNGTRSKKCPGQNVPGKQWYDGHSITGYILYDGDSIGPGPPRGGGAGGGKIPEARRLLGARQGPAGPLMSTLST